MPFRHRRTLAFILVGVWTALFVGMLYWDQETLAEIASQPAPAIGVERHRAIERWLYVACWGAGTGGILTAFFWLRRLDRARELAHTTLRENQQNLTALVAAIDDPVFGVDATGRVVYLEGAASPARAFASADAAGRLLEEVLPPAAALALRQALWAMATTGTPQEADYEAQRDSETVL